MEGLLSTGPTPSSFCKPLSFQRSIHSLGLVFKEKNILSHGAFKVKVVGLCSALNIQRLGSVLQIIEPCGVLQIVGLGSEQCPPDSRTGYWPVSSRL